MAEITKPSMYFVGGVPLTGKSEVVRHFEAFRSDADIQRPLDKVSTDGLRRVLWHNRTPEQDPNLFMQHTDRLSMLTDDEWVAYATKNPGYFVDRQQRQQSPSVWANGVEPYLRDNHERGVDTAFYGVAVMPSFVAQLPEEISSRAVFLGHNSNQPSDEYMSNVFATAREHPGHWMKAWPDAKIETYMRYVLPALSGSVMAEAEVLGYPYFDLSIGDYRMHHIDAALALGAE